MSFLLFMNEIGLLIQLCRMHTVIRFTRILMLWFNKKRMNRICILKLTIFFVFMVNLDFCQTCNFESLNCRHWSERSFTIVNRKDFNLESTLQTIEGDNSSIGKVIYILKVLIMRVSSVYFSKNIFFCFRHTAFAWTKFHIEIIVSIFSQMIGLVTYNPLVMSFFMLYKRRKDVFYNPLKAI